MKRLYYYITGTVILFGMVIFSTSVGAICGSNKRIKATNAKARELFVTLTARYTKVSEFNNSLEGLDVTATELVTTINNDIVRFEFSKNLVQTVHSGLKHSINIDTNFLILVNYLKDSATAYTNLTLPADFYIEFDALTPTIHTQIAAYNQSATDFNHHLTVFPNSLYVGQRGPFMLLGIENYPLNLPQV
ncbi:MAG: hypothetical protein BWY30_00512 [Tenericutes bacterium ADurb.Bin239]|nr:MAG: hypothetical protein BWY30_00512 [Tenericutes bacterium ADurb.Bin239]